MNIYRVWYIPLMIIEIPAKSLTHLLTLRALLTLALSGTVLGAFFHLDQPLNYPALTVILGLLTISAFVLLVRLKQQKNTSPFEFSCHLLLEMTLISGLLFYTGGAGNPLISYLILPVALAASTLPTRMSWSITVISVCLYTLLLQWYQPLSIISPDMGHHGHHSEGANMHLLGMWITFVTSAILITFFITRIAENLRLRDRQLNARREQDLRDEQLLGIAMVAAQTTHELATPLNSIKLLTDELASEFPPSEHVSNDILLVKQQADVCIQALKRIQENAQVDSQINQPLKLGDFINALKDHWQLLRPQTVTDWKIDSNTIQHSISLPATVSHAILNLLSNAADAGNDKISVSINDQDGSLCITISNEGEAPSQEMLARIDQPFTTTKSKGLGLGLYLTHATIERCGGALKLYHESGTTRTKILFKGILSHE